jgi:hypothetical protein
MRELGNGKSTLGYVFLSMGGAITWKSKKQTVTAQSSTEVEYVSMAEATHKACWLRGLYLKLGHKQKEPSIIKCNNEGAIAMARNLQFHQRAKHINIKYHLIKHKIKHKQIDVESCYNHKQTADVLTKAIPQAKHSQHTKEMGLVSAQRGVLR